jgi:hypothetical protein
LDLLEELAAGEMLVVGEDRGSFAGRFWRFLMTAGSEQKKVCAVM